MRNTLNFPKGSPSGLLEIDLHGMTVSEAKAALDVFLTTAPRGVTVTVIHGCNRGTALQKYVRTQYRNKRIERKILGLNQGSTDFLITR